MVTVAGARVRVHEWGEPTGLPLLHWHGLGTRAGLHVGEVAPILAAEHGFRVIAPDAPGFGGSPPGPQVRPSELADLAVGLLDALGVGRGPYMGWSWGGTIGCHLAARHGDRLTALVLLDAGHVGVVPEEGDLMDEVRREWEAECAASHDDLVARLKGEGGRWSEAIEASFMAGWHQRGGRLEPVTSPERFADAIRGATEEPPSSVWPGMARSGLPVLLVASDGARQEDVDRFTGAVPRLTVERLAGAGHDVCRDQPEAVARLVGDWLRTAPAS